MADGKRYKWFRQMSRSEQVVAAAIGLFGTFLGSGLTLFGTYIVGSAGTPAQTPGIVNNISGSTVNEAPPGSGVDPGSSAAETSPCTQQVAKPGSGSVGVFVDAKISGSSCWLQQVNPSLSDVVVRFLLTYQNDSHSVQRNVALYVVLPSGMSLVPQSTFIYNTSYPAGTPDRSDDIDRNGILIGNYLPGGGAYAVFSVKLPSSQALSCGISYLPVVGSVQVQGTRYNNSSMVEMSRAC
jgi:hypothetical protein